jgi:hypothetical protein
MVARKMHRTIEAYHAMVYFAPEAHAEYAMLGVPAEEYFKGYFASRAAPMGAVPGEVVVATFFNFNPRLVLAAIPAAWELAPPVEWQAARQRGVDAALRRMLGEEIASPAIGEALGLARTAHDACSPAGRPLYAGHASLDWPEEPHLALWHALTLVREYRGDGHIACLVERDLTPVEALILHESSGMVPPGFLQPTRQWSEDEWRTAEDRLRTRGWIDDAGSLTTAGQAFREEVEHRTDEVAMAPWRALGEDGCARLRQLVRPFSKRIVESGGLFGRGAED